MTIVLPDRESVELLHEAAINYSGGKPGVHNEGLILSAIGRPITFASYNEAYDIDDICAILIDSIARNHGFSDGNKRTALLTAIFTYRVNGIHFKATEEMNADFDELVMWVVNSKPSVKKVSNRLKTLRKRHEGNEESWAAMFTAFRNAMLNSGKHKKS